MNGHKAALPAEPTGNHLERTNNFIMDKREKDFNQNFRRERNS